FARPADLGAEAALSEMLRDPAVQRLVSHGNTVSRRASLAAMVREGQLPDESLDDDALDMVRDTFRRFAREQVRPHAHRWHLENSLIPDDVVAGMAKLGTFGVTIDERWGGLGMGKLAMCVVSEELSRGLDRKSTRLNSSHVKI